MNGDGLPKKGFVPTIQIILNTSSPDFLKSNQIKSGDKVSVFISNGGGMIKSYRADYVIRSVVTSDKPTEQTDLAVTYIIDGELYVPALRNQLNKYNFNGSSRDAMRDIAKRLGLAFFFCDPDDTNDYQIWYSSNNLYDFALDISTRSYKAFDAFYESWIDPRYGLSFININKMLGEDGFDELMDITPFVNVIQSGMGIDGEKAGYDEDEKRRHTDAQAKMLANIPRDEESASPFYIKKWAVVNRAAEITHEIGLGMQQALNIDNAGLTEDNMDVEMSYSIPLNNTKLNNGFFALLGPGINLTYVQADQMDYSMNFVRNSQAVGGGSITEAMSNGDAENIENSGGNMMSSGNNNRFYDVAYRHNMVNLLQLQKQYLEVELNGLNLAILRGEKIPVMIMDNDKVQAYMRAGGNKTSGELEALIYESASGWYIIDALMWEWQKNTTTNAGTPLWRTKLKLTRREWPIPGYCGSLTKTNDTIVYKFTANDGTVRTATLEGSGSAATETVQVSETDNTGGEVPLTGLKEQIKEVYRQLKQASPGAKLVAARRWAVDQEGKRVDGNAFVIKNGLYKCVNAKGDIMYFKENNSRHLYGEAFDVINGSGSDYNQMLSDIMSDLTLLRIMVRAGVCAVNESCKDDYGTVSKHIHIGTDKQYQQTFWQSIIRLHPDMESSLLNEINNFATYNKENRSEEIHRNTIDEDAPVQPTDSGIYTSGAPVTFSGTPKHFSVQQLCYSATAVARHIQNVPNETEKAHLLELICNLLDPIYEGWTEYCSQHNLRPGIQATSGFRSKALNVVIPGSAKNSAHMYGYAADTVPVNGNMNHYETFMRQFIKAHPELKFDQIIVERSKSRGSRWIHIGIRNGAGAQRNSIFSLTAV